MGEFKSILGKVARKGQFSLTEIASNHSDVFGWSLSQRREDVFDRKGISHFHTTHLCTFNILFFRGD